MSIMFDHGKYGSASPSLYNTCTVLLIIMLIDFNTVLTARVSS